MSVFPRADRDKPPGAGGSTAGACRGEGWFSCAPRRSLDVDVDRLAEQCGAQVFSRSTVVCPAVALPRTDCDNAGILKRRVADSVDDDRVSVCLKIADRLLRVPGSGRRGRSRRGQSEEGGRQCTRGDGGESKLLHLSCLLLSCVSYFEPWHVSRFVLQLIL